MALFPVRTVWVLALNNQLSAPPAYDREHVYFPISGDRLVSYTLADGAQQWLVEARPQLQPAVCDGLIFSPEPGEILARSGGDGSVVWRKTLPDPLSVAPVCSSGWLVVVTAGGSVLTYRAADGEKMWQRELNSPARAVPNQTADRVYVPTRKFAEELVQFCDKEPRRCPTAPCYPVGQH